MTSPYLEEREVKYTKHIGKHKNLATTFMQAVTEIKLIGGIGC